MIIVEGPDGSGKTTLAKRIADHWSMEYRRCPVLSSTDGPLDGAFKWYCDELARVDIHNGVYDRHFYFSEQVYSSVLARKPNANAKQMAWLAQTLFADRPFVVFVLPEDAIITANYEASEKRLKGLTVKKHVITIWQYWNLYWLWSRGDRKKHFLYSWAALPEPGWDKFPELESMINNYHLEITPTAPGR